MSLKQLPTFTTELIDELDQEVPVVGWTKGKTLEELAFAAGMRHLVEHLKARRDKSNKNILERQVANV